MTAPLATAVIDLVLGLELGASGDAAGNGCTVEGVAWKPRPGGLAEFRIRELEATALRLASGGLVLELGRIAARGLAGQVRTEGGVPRLVALEVAEAEFSGLKLHGPLVIPKPIHQMWDAAQAPGTAASVADTAARHAEAWRLEPLGQAEGTIRGEITDAHLLFDADVTVPIRLGQIDFNDATVEHVGPDSRMGVSRMGLYVDAPNGRSYVYQFASAPLAGVAFEHRGALLGPWVSERGKLQLQPFAESILRQRRSGPNEGLTQQARLLLGRTAMSGKVQLGDGLLSVPGLQVHLDGRGAGRNAVELHSEAVGRGLTLKLAAWSARDMRARRRGTQLACASATAQAELQLLVDDAQLRFALSLDQGKATGLRIDLAPSGSPVP